MTIYQNIIEKSTAYFTYITLILAFLIGLGAGILVGNGKSSQIIIDKNAKIGFPSNTGYQTTGGGSSTYTSGNFMASINGTAYYPKGCPSANRIKEENIIWFNTKEEAEAQGYKPAQNCGF